MGTAERDPPAVAANAPWFAIVAAAYVALTFGRLLSSEMFLDGVTYAAVARNLADGNGSFWATAYNQDFTPFRAQPPLAFWLESLAFRFFGDSPWVERLWGIALGAVALLLMVRVHRAAEGDGRSQDAAASAGWPLLLCASAPLVTWCCVNNMIENTLVVLVLAAAWGAIAAATSPARVPWLPVTGSGVALGLALLTKGPPALFVLSIPVAAVLVLRTRSAARVVAQVSAIAGVAAFVVAAFILAGGHAARAFVSDYLSVQVLPSLVGARETAPSRFFLAGELLAQLAVLLGVAVAVTPPALRSEMPGRRSRAAALAKMYLAVALAGTLPFLFLRKQMSWYLMPAMPFYALAIAYRFERGGVALGRWMADRAKLVWAVSLAVILAATIAATEFHGVVNVTVGVSLRDAWRTRIQSRSLNDRASEYCWSYFVRDILSEPQVLPPGSVVTDDMTQGCSWRALAYMERYLHVTVTPRQQRLFVLKERDPSEEDRDPVNCVQMQARRAKRFVLFRCTW
jgi:4-amino-4-deoxy-L-arabinose transferase-like glycosyltransferase